MDYFGIERTLAEYPSYWYRLRVSDSVRVLAIEGNLPVSQYVSDQDRSDLTLPLKDRVIIVVGGTTGLGLSAAAACVQAGGRVIACGLDQESVVRTQELLGDQVRIIVSDATDPQTAPRLVSLAQ
ncbi:MAG TPA: hypothetical protein DCF63_03775, partial [Planctomycetaceae bacterium]|nr:hypothetical protein [Planctomycetaceae bacterium]